MTDADDPTSPCRLVDSPAEADLCLAVDAANLVHRAYWANKELKTRSGRPSGHIFGALRTILAVLRHLPDPGTRILLAMCYEGKGSKDRRRELIPEYKANREQRDFNPLPEAFAALRALPGLHIEPLGREGDDALHWVANRFSNRYQVPVVVYSGDRDLWSLVRPPSIAVWSPNLDRYVGPDDIEKAYGSRDPKKVALAKALFGDASDGVRPAVPRLRRAHVIPVIRAAPGGAPADFYRALVDPGEVPAKTAARLLDARSRVELNYSVMVPDISGIEPARDCAVVRCGDREAVMAQVRAWDCGSLVGDVGTLSGEPYWLAAA